MRRKEKEEAEEENRKEEGVEKGEDWRRRNSLPLSTFYTCSMSR
jgi:hypothetical protein